MSSVVFLTLCFLSSALAALPNGWKACSKSAPDFESCLAKAFTNAVHSLAEGDKKLQVMPLDPLKFEKMTFPKTTGPVALDMSLTDGAISGLKDINIKHYKTDWVTGEAKGLIPKFEVISNYKVKAKVLVLPVEGEGKSNITYVDSDFDSTFKFKRETIDGVEHILIDHYTIDLHPKMVHIHLENLFNGNKELGEKTNEFLNQNWREILKEVEPVLQKPLETMFAMIGNNILKQIPASEIEIS